MKKTTILGLGVLLTLFVGCSKDSNSNDPAPEEPSITIEINGNTVSKFSFQNENVLFTRGCVTANLYDSSSSALSRNSSTEIAIATQDNYDYIASPYSNYGNPVYSIVYAKSMSIVPKTLISGTTYSYVAGYNDIKKIVLTESKTLVANASSSSHIQVYDENLNFVSDLYVTSSPIVLNLGTYYLLLKNGSCVNPTQITVNIL